MEVIEATPRIVRQLAGHSPIKGRIDARAKLRKAWIIHDLRRTVASGLPKIGVKLPVIERVLNHKGESFAGIVGVYQQNDFAGGEAARTPALG
jgi:hypothetical protein